MKRAQINQVFVYLISILVIGFLVIFGYRMINGLINNKCTLDNHQLLSAISDQFDTNNRYGRISKAELGTGCGYAEICFVDKNALGTTNAANLPTDSRYDIIKANAKDNVQYNVYLLNPDGDVLPVGFEDRLVTTKVDPPDIDAFCIDAKQGKFTFWLEGLGNSIYVYEGG